MPENTFMKLSRLLIVLIVLLRSFSATCQDKSFPYTVDLSLQTSIALSIDKVPLREPQKINKLLDSTLRKNLLKGAPGKKLTDAYNFYVLKTLAYSPALDIVIFFVQSTAKGKRYFYFMDVYSKANVLLSSKEIARYIKTDAEETSHTARLESTGRVTIYEDREEKVKTAFRITPAGQIAPDANAQGSVKIPGDRGKQETEPQQQAGMKLQVIKGNRKIMHYSLYPFDLPPATINAVIKVSPAGMGSFLGFAAGSSSNDNSYRDAVIEILKRTSFDRAEGETLITLSVMF